MEWFDFRPEAIRWWRGIWALGTLAIALLVAYFIDADALWVGVSALAAGLAYFDAPLRERLAYIAILTVLGAVIVAVAVALGGSTLADTLVLAAIVFAVTFVQWLGPPFVIGGFLLAAVGLIAILAAPTLDALPSVGLYLIGGGIAAVVIGGSSRFAGPPEYSPPTGALEELLPRLGAGLRPTSPALRFALFRALAVGTSTYIAQSWLEERWLWMVVPTVVLIVPTWDLASEATSKRLAGTLAGIAAFSLLSLPTDALAYRVLVFLAAAFFALVFAGTGTVSTVTLWTVFAFGLAWLLQDDFWLTEAVGERVMAVMAGSAIALVAVVLINRLSQPESDA